MIADLKDQLDHLTETLELALEPLEAMATVQREGRWRPSAEWWIERRQAAQQLVEQARAEVGDLQLLCDDGQVRNSAPGG